MTAWWQIEVSLWVSVPLIVMALWWLHLFFWRRYLRWGAPSLGERHWIVSEDGWWLTFDRHAVAPDIPLRGRIICCPGLACNSSIFHLDPRYSLADALTAAGFEVWLLSLRATGESQRPARSSEWCFGFSVYERDADAARAYLARWAERKGAAPLIWLGHSMGGLIGYQLCGRHQESFDALVTIASPADLSSLRDRVKIDQRIIARLMCLAPYRAKIGLALHTVAPWSGWLRSYPEPFFMNTARVSGWILRRALMRAFNDAPSQLIRDFESHMMKGKGLDQGSLEDWRRQITAYSGPTLVLVPTGDRLAPADCVRPGGAGAQRSLQEWEGWGHLDIIVGDDAKAEVYPALIAWLEERVKPAAVR